MKPEGRSQDLQSTGEARLKTGKRAETRVAQGVLSTIRRESVVQKQQTRGAQSTYWGGKPGA